MGDTEYMTRKLHLTIIALAAFTMALASCTAAPSASMHTASQESNIARFGKWGYLIANVRIETVDATELPENAGWFRSGMNDGHPTGIVSVHPDSYAQTDYVVTHELAHALGAVLQFSTPTTGYYPEGWQWGVENWADCVTLVIGTGTQADMTPAPYGCSAEAQAWAASFMAGPIPDGLIPLGL